MKPSTSRGNTCLNGEGIEHQPRRTDGDVLVFFRRSDVVVADILSRFPVIDVAGRLNGGSRLANWWIWRFRRADRLPKRHLVISGHGRVCDQFDVVDATWSRLFATACGSDQGLDQTRLHPRPGYAVLTRILVRGRRTTSSKLYLEPCRKP
jgi:hypothetical protein